MPTTAIDFNGRRKLQIRGQRVYAKTKWVDAWELFGESSGVARWGVHCTSASWAAAPSLPEAELVYRYGRGRARESAEENVLKTWDPLTLPSLAYVRIEFDVFDPADQSVEVLSWYGVTGRLVDSRLGDQVADVPSGFQSLPCVGMQWLLERNYILTSRVLVSASNPLDPQIEIIQRGLTFNDGRNRTVDSHLVSLGSTWSHNGPVFSHDRNGESWSTRSIVNYLLAFQTPVDVNDKTLKPIFWRLADPNGYLPDWDSPVIDSHALTTSTILRQLIPRTRGLGYYFDVVPGAAPGVDAVELRPFTFVGADVSLAAGLTLPANQDQYEIKNRNDRSGGAVVVVDDAFSRFHRVRVRGRRQLTVFSFSTGDIDLTAGWDVDGYERAATSLPGYPDENEWDQRQAANKYFREHVANPDTYRRFVFPADWDYLARGGELALQSEVSGQADYSWVPGCRVSRKLPLQAGVDYSQSPFQQSAGSVFLDPFVVFKLSFGPDRYVDSRVMDSLGITDQADNFDWSAHIVPLDGECGFNLEVRGAPKHVIDFGNSALVWQPEDERLGGWELSEAIFTVAVFSDTYCERVIDSTAAGVSTVPAAEDFVREKIIEAGDSFQLNRIVEGTVFGVDESGALREYGGGVDPYVRDDRDAMLPIARLALEWYGRDRRAISFDSSQLTAKIRIGGLITKLIGSGDPPAETEVNTVVTRIDLQTPIVKGDSVPVPRMNWQTSYAELDVLGVS